MTCQIVGDAGGEASSPVKCSASKDANFGYDARSGELVDMIEMGIIDPVKGVRTALQMRRQLHPFLLTTKAMISELLKKPAPVTGSVQDGSGEFGDLEMQASFTVLHPLNRMRLETLPFVERAVFNIFVPKVGSLQSLIARLRVPSHVWHAQRRSHLTC
ncbi:hypothetical protein G9X64_06930 [Rhizobium sophorae]|uniref:Uncharacterized protein n=1 Tax=Rhizobium sophorae TaxID=1535242 RepID=A0A7Y3WD94_9HYPH|nr:hypothetical protein [Rhizobium sophorae]MBX4862909.1 hypothetical protein [Rhizobium bangladeshense]NKL37943.1 hypothetical protein [Rhizobium leguminosarum bv. viciae]NNU36220.1 hypothetical protein [Rhizobium sophorae]